MTTNGTNLSDTSLGCYAQGTEGDMTQCVVESVFAAGPAPGLMGLLMAGTLLTSLYVAGDGDLVVPAVITVLFGTILTPMLPPQFRTFAYTVFIIGGVVAVFAAYTRFTHQTRF
jgi:hypothetical protein